ncbi:MAG TPA: response regulator [Thermoanaerobaculia bacterium]|nr:response regulator [Thermoanaerobaculia bacterium]
MGQTKRALVVDDDEPIRTMLANVVSRQGVEVDTASDGVEAIERIDRQHYDVILLDLMMPRVDGYGVLGHLKEHHPDRLACTIVASAVPQPEVLKRFQMPVFRIHAKPFDMQKLIGEIRQCVGNGNR